MTRPTPPADEYVLGAEDAEIGRLALQHRLWTDTTFAHWRVAGFRPGQTVLDLGAGPGFASRDLAQLLGSGGRVLAADRSRRFLDFVEATPTTPGAAPIETLLAEAEDLDLPEGSLDGAYARWVFTFITDPSPVLNAMARALKPGARLAIMDYSHWEGLFWAPHRRSLPIVRRAIMSRYEEVGAQPDVAQILPERCLAAGLEIHALEPVACYATPGDALWLWPTTYFDIFLPKLVELGHMTGEELELWRGEWRELATTPGAFFQTPPQALLTVRKPR
jgi:SAM-dependent methyltransferase